MTSAVDPLMEVTDNWLDSRDGSITGIEQLNAGTTPKTVHVVATPSVHSPAGKAPVEFEAAHRIGGLFASIAIDIDGAIAHFGQGRLDPKPTANTSIVVMRADKQPFLVLAVV